MYKKIFFAKTYSLVLLFLVLSSSVFSNCTNHSIESDTASSSLTDNSNDYVIGGGFGLQFGDVTMVSLSPLLGYKIKPNWFIAFQPSYTYYKKSNRFAPDDIFSIWGFSVFSRVFVYKGLFLHGGYEKNIWEDSSGINHSPNSVILGGGYCYDINSKLGFTFMLGFDVLQESDSFYGKTLIYQVGIWSGF